jgi:hypothetical protein
MSWLRHRAPKNVHVAATIRAPRRLPASAQQPAGPEVSRDAPARTSPAVHATRYPDEGAGQVRHRCRRRGAPGRCDRDPHRTGPM